MALEIETLPLLKDNFSYLLRNGDSNAVTIIDPGESEPVIRYLEEKGWQLERVICTHHHWDHVDGVPELTAHYGCPVFCSSHDLARIRGATHGLNDGATAEIAGHKMLVTFLPGHTQGQMALYFADRKALFVGDTLFSLGCGRLKEGTAEQLYQSLQKIAAFPASTRIYFGHEYTLRNGAFAKLVAPSNALDEYLESVAAHLKDGGHSSPSFLALEKRLNPFMNAGSLEEFTRRRAWRDTF